VVHRLAGIAVVVAVAGAGCGSRGDGDGAACTCTPTAGPSSKLLDLLRRHQRAAAGGQGNGRDIKLVDDEIRAQAVITCEPCGGWVGDRARPDELFPLDRLDDAVSAGCALLRLRDGSVAYGDARPAACRAEPAR
jgi:hypothetical protein